MRFGPFLVTRIVTGIRSRWFSLVMMLLLAAVSRGGFALGLGEMQVTSVINEPLSATIPVLNADAVQQSELIVALGSASDYEATGVSWDFTHSELQFDVSTAANGTLVVNVTSSRPIREPYLNVLVQARWPAGRLLMEYTVLLDFPVFSGQGNSASASASSSSTASSTVSSVNEPTPQPVAAPRPAPAPEPVQAAPAPRLVSGAPAEQRVDSLATDEFRIQNGDTLWSLGGQVAQDLGISRHQAMLAIREANPDAFIEGDINLLRSGSVVRVPPRNAAIARSEAQAAADFAQAMSGAGRFADGTPLQSRVTDFRDEGGNEEAGTAQFRLTAGAQGDTAAAGSGVEELVEENQTLADTNAALEEELAAAQITNRDLNDRLQNLEEQIAVMEALIEVENNEIRAVQEAVTAVQPVVQPATTAVVQEEPGILSKILSWLPLVGVVLVGLLVGAYLLIRKRKSEGGFDDTEYMEDAPVYEEDAGEEETAEAAEETAESDDEAMPDLEADDLDDFMDLGDTSEDTESDEPEVAEESADEEEMDLPDIETEEAAEEDSLVEDDEDWGSDFDDLDSFFSGAEDEDGDQATDTAAKEESSDEPEEEDETEKTQIFNAEAMAEMAAAEREDSPGEIDLSEELEADEEDAPALDAEAEDVEELPEEDVEEDESILDFSLDEEDLGSEDNEAKEPAETSDAEDDEFSLDFDLDAVDSLDEDESDSETEEDADNSEAADENTLSFDVSDMDLPDTEGADAEAEPEEEESEAETESDDLDALLDGVDDLEDISLNDSKDDSAEDLGEDLADAEADLDSLLGDLEDEGFDSAEAAEAESEDEPTDDLEDFDATIAVDDLELPDLEEDAEESAEETTEDAESDEDLLGDFEADLDDVDSEMSEAEEAETKLELAAAYMEMGDSTGAKELLEEVVRDGDDDSKEKAQGMLDSLG